LWKSRQPGSNGKLTKSQQVADLTFRIGDEFFVYIFVNMLRMQFAPVARGNGSKLRQYGSKVGELVGIFGIGEELPIDAESRFQRVASTDDDARSRQHTPEWAPMYCQLFGSLSVKRGTLLLPVRCALEIASAQAFPV